MSSGYVAAGCNTIRGIGYSLDTFLHEQDLHAKWVRAVKKLGRPLKTFNVMLQSIFYAASSIIIPYLQFKLPIKVSYISYVSYVS